MTRDDIKPSARLLDGENLRAIRPEERVREFEAVIAQLRRRPERGRWAR